MQIRIILDYEVIKCASNQEVKQLMNLNTLCEITQEIRKVVIETMSNSDDYGELVKVRPRDITRKIDLVAEDALDTALENRSISARIISEEIGDRIVGRNPQCLLVFDPVDGSTNATCGIPFFCTSLALCEKIDDAMFDDVTLSAITTAENTTYSAVKNGGAYVNNKKITGKRGARTSPILSIYAYGVEEMPEGIIQLEKHIIQRTLGSIALEMCYVAEGTLDGLIDTRGLVSSYDIMASQLILSETGGFITNLRGEQIIEDALASCISLIATADKNLHNNILKYLQIGTD